MESTKFAVLTSGGDAPGMNAAVRAVVKVAAGAGIAVDGIEDGFTGLIEGRSQALSVALEGRVQPRPELDFWGSQGGTLLGSARELRFHAREGRAPAVARLAGYAGLIVIGGNGSLAGAHALGQETSVPIVGIPASIDNDVGCTGMAIGVDTALNTIVDCCDRICDTARAHHRAFIVEVMGRDCGYLAMAGAVAAGADAVLLREQGRDQSDLVEAVDAAIRKSFANRQDKRRVLILKAEGIKVSCPDLAREVQVRLERDGLGIDVRATVLGHLVRGGTPTYADRMIAGRLGFVAVRTLVSGGRGLMLAWQTQLRGGTPTDDPSVSAFELSRVLEESEALVDGSSPLTQRRMQMMGAVEGVLGL